MSDHEPIADRRRWEDRYRDETRPVGSEPSAWVMARCLELPASLTIVDVGAGRGRHAVALAERGRRVIAADFVERAVCAAVAARPEIIGLVADALALPLREGAVDALLTVNYLDRSLFPRFARLLRPGGYLIVETYTTAQMTLIESGRATHPRNPAYMLALGELPQLVAPLQVLSQHEGLVHDAAGERYVAGVVAVNGLRGQRPGTSG